MFGFIKNWIKPKEEKKEEKVVYKDVEKHIGFYEFILGIDELLEDVINESERTNSETVFLNKKENGKSLWERSGFEVYYEEIANLRWVKDRYSDKFRLVGTKETEEIDKIRERIWNEYMTFPMKYNFYYVSVAMGFLRDISKNNETNVRKVRGLKSNTEGWMFNYKWEYYCFLNKLNPKDYDEIGIEKKIYECHIEDIIDNKVVLHRLNNKTDEN